MNKIGGPTILVFKLLRLCLVLALSVSGIVSVVAAPWTWCGAALVVTLVSL